jgi:hypothetical protein
MLSFGNNQNNIWKLEGDLYIFGTMYGTRLHIAPIFMTSIPAGHHHHIHHSPQGE